MAPSNSTALCSEDRLYVTCIMITDVLTVVIGQPVMARLLWIVFRAKKRDILNINLAFFHNIQYLLSTVHFLMALNSDESSLRIVKFLSVYVLIGGPATLAFICLERYVAVVQPTVYPLLKTRRCREACAASAWVVVLPVATVKAMANKDSNVWIIWMDVISYTVMLLTIGVMAWCNVAILRALRESGGATDKLNPAKKRASQTVRAISVLVLLCYTPVAVTNCHGFLAGQTCVNIAVTIFLLSLASVVHPVFYLATTDPFCLVLCHRPTATK